MKKPLIMVLLALLAGVLGPTAGFSSDQAALEAQIEGLDARQALALANQWHWERQPVRTSITPKEVIFQFQNGAKKTVALPEGEMMVAVAPYVDQTHK